MKFLINRFIGLILGFFMWFYSISVNNKFFIFLYCFLCFNNAFADEVRNRSIKSYFVDNIVFQTLYAGGYNTLGVILVLAIISAIFKTFRTMLLSLLMAIFGIFLLVFVYQAFEDFEFIPPMY